MTLRELDSMFRTIATNHFGGRYMRYAEFNQAHRQQDLTQFWLLLDSIEGEMQETNKGQVYDHTHSGFYIVRQIERDSYPDELAAIDDAKINARHVIGHLWEQYKARNIKGFQFSSISYAEVDFGGFVPNVRGLHFTFSVFRNYKPLI